MASRDINDLSEDCRAKYLLFEKAMTDKGLKFIVTCTARTYNEQVALYAQGRQPL
jgi:hypothetical protein